MPWYEQGAVRIHYAAASAAKVGLTAGGVAFILQR